MRHELCTVVSCFSQSESESLTSENHRPVQCSRFDVVTLDRKNDKLLSMLYENETNHSIL